MPFPSLPFENGVNPEIRIIGSFEGYILANIRQIPKWDTFNESSIYSP